jgi:hypothetical protein
MPVDTGAVWRINLPGQTFCSFLKYKHSVRSAKLAQSHESEHTLPIFFPLHNLTGLLAGLDEAYLIDPSPIAAGTCAALVAYGLASGRHLTLNIPSCHSPTVRPRMSAWQARSRSIECGAVGVGHARLLASTRIDSYLVPGLVLLVLNIPTPQS